MSKKEAGLYALLTQILKESDHPVTCVEAYERADVRALADSANRVSDYLGGLWRKGAAARLPFTRTDRDASRWAYVWNDKPAAPRTAPQATPQIYADSRTTLLERPNILITEFHDTITIDLAQFSITIRPH